MESTESTQEDLIGISAFSVNHPHLMIVICILIVLLGALGITKMPKDLLPSSNQPAV